MTLEIFRRINTSMEVIGRTKKYKLTISLSDEDYKRINRLTGGYSKSQIISFALKELENKYPMFCAALPPLENGAVLVPVESNDI